MDLTKKRYPFYIRIGIILNALGTLETRVGRVGFAPNSSRKRFSRKVWRKPCCPCCTFQRA